MIDMLDIVEFISQNFDEAQLLGEGFEAIFEQAERFGSTHVHEVVGTSSQSCSFTLFPYGSSIFFCL